MDRFNIACSMAVLESASHRICLIPGLKRMNKFFIVIVTFIVTLNCDSIKSEVSDQVKEFSYPNEKSNGQK
jgi:hypothetical protein